MRGWRAPGIEGKRIALCAAIGALVGATLKLSQYRDDWPMFASSPEEWLVLLALMASCALIMVAVLWALPYLLSKLLRRYFVD